MSPALLNLIFQLVQLAIHEIPELINAEQTIISLISSGANPNPQQIEQLNQAHDLIKDKLAAKLDADLGPDDAA